MTASLNNVVTVTLLPEGQALARDNMNVVMVITSEQIFLDSANRYSIYFDIGSVATDWGTSSEVYAHALSFFGTVPNAVNAGGAFVVGYWRAASENVAATSAVLTGAQITEATVVSQLQTVQDGSFDIDIDGVTENIAGLDFRTAINLDGIASIINAALTGGTCVANNSRLVITSNTTGVTSLITFVTDPGAGTYVGSILALADGTGAVAVQGTGASVLSAETAADAIAELKSQINFKGFVFIDQLIDADRKTIAQWAQANSTLGYEVFNDSTNLDIDPTNVVWDIKLSSLSNYRMLYSAAGNRRLATTYMARMHVVNFSAENVALTMNLKTLSVAAEEYTQSEITAAQNVGLDIYTIFKNVPKVLSSGANDFTDNRYNLIAFIDAVQTDMFNLLGTTSTKIPQTRRGVNQLIDQGEKTTRQFVRAGVFGPGTWSSSDYFGDKDTFDRAIETSGFYWLAGSLADQPQSERQARISPVLQAAVKNQGAVHKADIIIFFNY